MKRKLPAILILVALVVTVFSLSCSAYWVSVGTRYEDFSMTPIGVSFRVYSRGSTSSTWNSFGNYYGVGNPSSASTTLSDISYDISTDIAPSQTAGNYVSALIYTPSYLDNDLIDRVRLNYPAIVVQGDDSLEQVHQSILNARYNTPSYNRINYEVSYTLSWVSPSYSEEDGKSTVEVMTYHYTDTINVSWRADRGYSDPYGILSAELVDNGLDYRYDMRLPSIGALVANDSELYSLIEEHYPLNERFIVQYDTTMILPRYTEPEYDSLKQFVVYTESKSGFDWDYFEYDPSRYPLIEDGFKFVTGNAPNFFGFIADSIGAFLDVNIAGVKIGDILGIGIALSVLIIVLKVFAGG